MCFSWRPESSPTQHARALALLALDSRIGAGAGCPAPVGFRRVAIRVRSRGASRGAFLNTRTVRRKRTVGVSGELRFWGSSRSRTDGAIGCFVSRAALCSRAGTDIWARVRVEAVSRAALR